MTHEAFLPWTIHLSFKYCRVNRHRRHRVSAVMTSICQIASVINDLNLDSASFDPELSVHDR